MKNQLYDMNTINQEYPYGYTSLSRGAINYGNNNKLIIEMKCKVKQLIVTILMIGIALCFQFQAPSPSCLDYTINKITSCSFVLYRDSDINLNPTPWNSQLVPAGSTIILRFPAEYTLSGTETCASVSVRSISVTGYSCTVSVSLKSITITGAIPTATYIDNVVITVAGVKNPSPALVTSSFTATIGTDVSASDSSGTISLSPGAFQSLTINFDPTTVNSTSNMIITAVLGNSVSANSTITVSFPGFTWTREVTPTNLLPISSVNSCSAITNLAYTMRCSGSSTTVSLTSPFSSALASSTAIKFSINNLFSPPTTQQIDLITVTTYSDIYKIDSSSALISGLTPKSVNLTISTPTAFIINSDVVIDFSFILADTISKWDTITIQFPANSTVVTNPYTCSFSLSSISYNSATSLLTLIISSTSTLRIAGTAFTLRLRSYRTPSSVRITDPFTIRVMNGTGLKMEGAATISILPRAYPATCTTLNSTINSITTYTVVFNLADEITSSGYFLVKIPSQLTLSAGLGVQLISTSMAAIPIVEFVNSSVIKVRSLNNSNSNIAVQSVSIQITGLQQPSSVKTISSFVVDIYYSSSNDLVAEATTSTVITTTPGAITNPSITPSSMMTSATNVRYDFLVHVSNALPLSSKIMVTVPSTVGLASGGTCFHQSAVTTCTVLASNSTVTFNLLTAVTAGSTISVSYSFFTNPPSTRPTTTFGFATFNNLGESVDVLGSTPATITMINLSDLTSASLIRGSRQNSLATTYTFMFTQPQPIAESTAIASFVFPSDIVLPTPSPACSSGSATLICTLVGSNQINVQFSAVNSANTIYNFTILSITNPSSYKSTSSISITTLTVDLLYKYSTLTSGLEVTNNVPSNFAGLSYNFTNQILSANTNLVIGLNMTNSPGYILVHFAASFAVSSSATIACFSSEFVPLCSIILNNETNLYQLKVLSASTIPTSITLTLSSLTNPSTIPSDYTWVTTFTSDNYKMSQNRNTIQFTTFCTFPCRQCLTSSRTTCTSCYTTNLTNKIYLFQQQCISSCPSAYIEDNINFVCSPCALPCYECVGSNNYCSSCIANSTYKYLNRTNTTSTCLSECPTYMYADLTQIPNLCVDCISPCRQCSSRSVCITCVSPYLLYGIQCLASCPVGVTVQVNSTCQNCSSSCLTCSISISNCTSCPVNQSLYNGVCYVTCPGSLISVNNLCVSCDPTCLTCSGLITNCTSCSSTGNYLYYYNFMCLATCPDFYYFNTFNRCLPCEGLGIGCKNCSSPTVCVSCDPGYVLLNSRCLSAVPDGYLNISGIAVPCQGECATCFNTLTNCTACRTLNLFNNTCQSTCPIGTVALNRVCQACAYPCSQCVNITTKCTKCATNSSLYLSINSCVSAQSCPTFTYAQNSTQVCTSCVSPCSQCNSSTVCLTCVSGYFYHNETSLCQSSCPLQTVGINRVCVACISPCLNCAVLATSCRSCISNYYYNSHTNQCLSTCPSGQIANETTMECVSCTAPCKTCVNTTDTCLSCNTGTYLSNSLCVVTCPAGQFGATGLCRNCENNCTTCSNAVTCLSCSTPYYLYSNQCLSQCPVTHSIISNDNVCLSCTTVVNGCSNCSVNGECYSCYFPLIYYNSYCIQSCPEGYVYADFTCQIKNQTDVILTETLESYTFPIPFTILGCVVFIACCMSKLQNSNTYMIGLLYSLFGLIETGSLVYLIYTYYSLGSKVYVLNYLYIMLAVLGAIYVLNVLGLIVQTPYLVSDIRFDQWLKTGNKCFFSFITLLSALINYKSKMLLFTKLFRFHCLNSRLQNVYRFRVFNVFSFFGILPQGLNVSVSIMLIIKFTFQNSIFHALLDVVIIYLVNIVLAVLIVWKPDSFFQEETEQGYAINKKINVNGDDYSKQAIMGDQIDNQLQKHAPQSYVMISKSKMCDIEQISDELQVSLTQKQPVMQVAPLVKAIKVYFSNNAVQDEGHQEGQTSNPFRNQGKTDSLQKIEEKKQNGKVSNIFSQLSDHEQRYSHHEGYQSLKYESEDAGGSENLEFQQSPHRHSTLVVGPVNLKTNIATDNDDINNKISEREKELDQIKKQLDEQQQIRKEKRKSKKKFKKTIEINLQQAEQQPPRKQDPEPTPQPVPKPQPKPQPQPDPILPQQTSFQQISIRDSSVKQHTQEDTNLKTVEEQKNAQLSEQPKQATIEDHFQEVPKQSIGSWMEIRIAEENKKLPIFSDRIRSEMKTMSLPQSHPEENQEQAEQEQQIKKPDLVQQLMPAKCDQQVDQDLKQYQNTIKRKEQPSQDDKDLQSLQVLETLQKDGQQLSSIAKQTVKRDMQSIQTIKNDTIISNHKHQNENISKPVPPEHVQQNCQYSYYAQNITNVNQDSSNQKISEKQSINGYNENQFYFQQDNTDFDQRAGTRLNFQNLSKNKTIDDSSGLEDSHHEDQKINQRPYSAARKNKIQNSEALLEILAKVEQDKLTLRKAVNHKIPQKDQEDKAFKYSGGPIKSEVNEQQTPKDEEIHNRSRMYMAGLSQFQKQEESKLNRKKTMNYPLSSLKKKSLQDSELSNSFNQIKQSRNKSFNNPPFRKFVSKDLSSDNLDELGVEHEDYKKNYQQLMNERQRYPISTRKPGTSGTARSNSNVRPSQGNSSQFRRVNFTRDHSQEIVQEEDQELRQYYRKQKNKSNQKREKGDRNKSMSKQKSFEQTKRIKQLERIYLSKK